MGKLTERIREHKYGRLLLNTFKQFSEENSMFHGAALAYYAVFAMVPLLYLAITIFGWFVGNDTMIEIISTILKENVGLKDTGGILEFLQTLDFEKGSLLLSIVGFVALMVSSTAFLTSMRASINVFFDVKPEFSNARKKIVSNIISRLTSLSLMMLMGLIVVVFYFAEITFLSFTDQLLEESETVNGLLRFSLNHAVPVISNTVIFSFIFKYLHDGIVTWRVAKRGAFFTGTLLYLGQILIKYYLTHYFFASGGGVAGSILVILVWMFYTSQIIFLGAKFTKVYGEEVEFPIRTKRF